ncbi:hypothetical protein T8K17_12730 [Thalassobaculum sp. OXR-137]|uniref:hypothetical protein n=1 Tax=Thalassobaculum sp. OXR-137 TaxID=3100173 RepID=UPI002AC89FAF|nr:hypothetical protein [Thalassobaculum sp. OXR-137]WPZ36991.1 hypothetical protein T8K17_12730 [Thalassobaculum sp. OXR-137]
MSYESENILDKNARLIHVLSVIKLLNYKSIRFDLKKSGRRRSYVWIDNDDYKSWVGVELHVYQVDGKIIVNTRSSASRSYWDLAHQNNTIKTLRDLFGGYFRTDAGKNRYWRPDEPPPSPMSSGCYLARWRFNNSIMKSNIYLMNRHLKGGISLDRSSGFYLFDEINPRIISNNLIIPFVIGVWEEYFRATFSAVLRYADKREIVLKKARLSHSQLEQIASERRPLEDAIADCFSFQRPSNISENFKMIDPKLNLAGVLRKPFRGRKINLYDSIEYLVENRNFIVHSGELDISLFDRKLKNEINDVIVAVDRVYLALGNHFNFVPISGAW